MNFFKYIDTIEKHTYHPDDDNSKFKIKDIFKDHWNSFLEDNPELNILKTIGILF